MAEPPSGPEPIGEPRFAFPGELRDRLVAAILRAEKTAEALGDDLGVVADE